MGWGSASQFAEELWRDIRDDLPAEKRQGIAQRLFNFFRGEDADAWWGRTQASSLEQSAYPEEPTPGWGEIIFRDGKWIKWEDVKE